MVKNGVKLLAEGIRRELNDKQTFLFDKEDQDLSKHQAVDSFLRGQSVTSYRNVKIGGTILPNYFDFDAEKFVFNGKVLKEDLEKTICFDEEGKRKHF